jgi:hypothetical protein
MFNIQRHASSLVNKRHFDIIVLSFLIIGKVSSTLGTNLQHIHIRYIVEHVLIPIMCINVDICMLRI